MYFSQKKVIIYHFDNIAKNNEPIFVSKFFLSFYFIYIINIKKTFLLNYDT
jgi:hypothetical protein